MFVPLHDDTPLKVIRFQFVTLAIIVGNVIIFLMTGAFQSDVFWQMSPPVLVSSPLISLTLHHKTFPIAPFPSP